MSEQFHLRFASAAAAELAHEKLGRVTIGGRPAFSSSLDGSSILTGCAIFEELPPDALLSADHLQTPFYSVFYLVDLKKSGMHHRDGMAWFRMPGGRHSDRRDPVPIMNLAPTILAVLGIEKPAYMTGGVMEIPDLARPHVH
jgi:hypothetical protein